MPAKRQNNNSMLLYGKHILVSGAAAEYAEAIVMGLAAEGASLILVDKDKGILKNLAAKVNDKYGLATLPLALDMRYDRDKPYHNISNAITARDINHLDGLITLGNYQGIPSNTLTYPTPLWKDTMQINLDSVFILVKNLLPFLLSAPSPSIVFSLMDESQMEASNNIADGVASYALEGFTRVLASEMVNSHLTVCGMKLGKEFYSGNQSKQISMAADVPKILAAQGKQYHNRILAPSSS